MDSNRRFYSSCRGFASNVLCLAHKSGLWFERLAMRWGCPILVITMLFFMSSCAQPIPSNLPSSPEPMLPKAPSAEGAPKSEDRLTITIVYDNNDYDQRLEAKWGFSCLIEGPEKTILFDTGGDGVTLLSNLRKLNIDPRKVDAVMLSHIHGDHVGGLSSFLEENSDVIVYLPQSFPETFKHKVKSFGAVVDEVSEGRELFTGVYTTGELGRGIKEQSLVVKTSQGLVIVTGCAHPGVVNIIRAAKNMVGQEAVYLAVGGFHLMSAPTAQIESLIQEFRRLSVKEGAPCHCSGDKARRLFKEQYGEDYIPSGVGKRITIP